MSLDAAAADFAGELSNLFAEVFAAQVVFEVYENPKGKDTRRLTISQRTSGGIPLNIQGQTVFRLLLGYEVIPSDVPSSPPKPKSRKTSW